MAYHSTKTKGKDFNHYTSSNRKANRLNDDINLEIIRLNKDLKLRKEANRIIEESIGNLCNPKVGRFGEPFKHGYAVISREDADNIIEKSNFDKLITSELMLEEHIRRVLNIDDCFGIIIVDAQTIKHSILAKDTDIVYDRGVILKRSNDEQV